MTLENAEAIAPAGTWLAEVSRDETLTIIGLLNTAIDGLCYVRDLILVGEDATGAMCADGPRHDKVADTTRTALHDLTQLQLMVKVAAERLAAAAVAAGVPLEQVASMVPASIASAFLHAVQRHLHPQP